MDDQRRNRRNLVQNILITLLTVTAAALFTQTQLYSLGLDRGASTFSGAAQPAAVQAAELTAPVRVAVTGSYGRYGSAALTTGSEAFADALGRRLAEALGSARDYLPCTEGEFLAALEAPSVYYDFLEPLPLPVLARLAGGGELAEDRSARRLILSGRDGGTALYLWDGGDTWLRAEVAVSRESLERTVDGYELGGAVFALDVGADLAPCSLLPRELPELPVLTAGEALTDTDSLLSALGFNPRLRSRYLESNGTELITDGNRTLRIRSDRTIVYNSGGDASLKIPASDDVPTLWEAAQGVGNLLSTLPSAGEASLCLQSIRQSGSATVLRFGYQVRGVPVRFADGGCAAEAALTGRTVDSLSLRLRHYTDAGKASLLLPLEQTLAVAEQKPGAELTIGYVDAGGDCAAHWLAE